MKRNQYRTGAFKWSFLQSALAVSVVAAVAAVIVGGRVFSPAYSEGNEIKPTAAIVSVKAPAGREVATLSGGCFWAMQAMFGMVKGVDSAGPGYAGGTTKDPTYEEVCTETTGYAETIQVIYDPKVVSYHDLLTMYFHAINPTELNRQGDDEGTSYRSAIFYHNDMQKAEAEKTIAEINASHLYQQPIVTQVVPYTGFYPAESYHNNYFANNPDTPYCQYVVAPKVAHFKALYGSKLK